MVITHEIVHTVAPDAERGVKSVPVLCSEGEGNDETNKEICDGLSLSTESLRNSMSEQDVDWKIL